ncbi:MAG: hypothetical protein QOG15_467 [Solirubrobacteraceae bacterium]|nr:hypothetical protein [Solirubrobacteraceae bacterium]
MTPASTVRHPVFARAWHRLTPGIERELGPCRRELLAGLSGRVVEVGAGNGMNFRHYPDTVTEVVAVEPEPYLRARAEAAARAASVPIVVCDGLAGALAFADESFDAAVACLVLCSVPDQASALAELRRVATVEGELRFLEHVRAGATGKARIQEALDRSRLWPLVAGGCHCARDTVAAISAAGFAIDQVRELNLGPGWLNTNPHVLGAARRRA